MHINFSHKTLFQVNLLIILSFLDFLCASAVLMSLSNFMLSLNASKMTVGLFASFYGGLQLPSSYLMGLASSRFGIRNCLVVACLITSLGYVVLGSSTSLWAATLGRAIIGLFKHSNNLCRTMLSMKFSKQFVQLKANKMGQMSSATSFGFILGPLAGGYLYDQFGFFMVSLFASSGFFLMACLVYFLLEEDANASQEGENTVKEKNSHVGDASQKSLDSNGNLIRLLFKEYLLQFLMALTVIVYRSNYSLVIKEAFHVTTTQVSMLTSYQAAVGTISGVAFGPLLHYVARGSSTRMLFICSCLRFASIALAGFYAPPSVFWLVICIGPLPLADTLSRESFQMLWTARGVSRRNLGKVIGLSGSLLAFSRLIGPVLGGYMHEHFGIYGPAILSSLFASISVGISLSL